MRWDQISGWQLFAAQIIALVVVTPLWGIGALFRRSRTARWLSMVLALVLGAALAVGLLNTDEARISSYVFGVSMFALGTLMMAAMLLIAIPQTRGAAPGAAVAVGLLVVIFVLTYWFVFTFAGPVWLRPTYNATGGSNVPETSNASSAWDDSSRDERPGALQLAGVRRGGSAVLGRARDAGLDRLATFRRLLDEEPVDARQGHLHPPRDLGVSLTRILPDVDVQKTLLHRTLHEGARKVRKTLGSGVGDRDRHVEDDLGPGVAGALDVQRFVIAA